MPRQRLKTSVLKLAVAAKQVSVKTYNNLLHFVPVTNSDAFTGLPALRQPISDALGDAMISFQQTEDLPASAKITYTNMRSYYEHYAVDWDCSKIEEQIRDLVNFDILLNDEVVGAIRLVFDNDGCHIRDLQVCQNYQGKGIGSAALSECESLATDSGVNRLILRVFKISPAFNLYERSGFVVDSDDDRFYNMSRTIT